MGYSHPDTLRRIKAKTGRAIPDSTLSAWIAEHDDLLTYRRLRDAGRRRFPPAQTVRSIKVYHRRKPITLVLPILPDLQILEASPVGELTFLVTEHGRPFAVAGFGNWFRERCNEAGLPHCTSHGLRKAAATVAAENGATAHELMSIFGWLTLKEAERYTRAAGRKKLAERGMGRLVPIRPGTQSV